MTLRFKLMAVQFVSAGVIATLGMLAFEAFKSHKGIAEDLALSIRTQETVQALNGERTDRNVLAELQRTRAQLQPAHRMEALSSVIQAYGEQNPRLLERRAEHFTKNEKEYRKFITPQLEYHSRRTLYFGVLAAGVMSGAMLLTWILLVYNVLNPLKLLSRRMTDFLHDRYTYQFSAPAQNEMGHLQATFNSMAQRVLTNMEELKTLDNAKSEFLSIASHELRTPLTSIKGSLSLLNTGVVGKMNEAAQNLLNIAQNETDRLIRLINDLLDLAKIEARKLPLRKEWVPLPQLIRQTFEGLDGLARTASVSLDAPELPAVEIHMDKDRIHQVVTNLLSNAIKFSPKGGVVTVRCELQNDHDLEIQVIDQGKGIAPEDQELIFQKFRQATSAKNPLVKGTGLGLAIVKALVEEHEGQIGVRSTPGKGSTFYFTLPQWRLGKQKHGERRAGAEAA